MLHNISSARAHQLSWFNPRTGLKTPIAAFPTGTTEVGVPSQRPGGGAESWLDWVLLLEPLTASKFARWPGTIGTSGTSGLPTIGTRPADAGATGTSWVTSVSLAPGAKERSGGATVGCSFTATATVTVTSLCRLPTNGSQNVEPVGLFAAATGAKIAEVGVDALHGGPAARDPHGFACALLPSPASDAHIDIAPLFFQNGAKHRDLGCAF